MFWCASILFGNDAQPHSHTQGNSCICRLPSLIIDPTTCHAVTAHLMGLHSAIKMLNSRVWIIQQLVQKMQSGV